MSKTELRRQLECVKELLMYNTQTLPLDLNCAREEITEGINILLGVGLNAEFADKSYHHLNHVAYETEELIEMINGSNKEWLLELERNLNEALNNSI